MVAQPIKHTILSRIRGHGRGWVFTPREFIDVADRRVVSVTLGRLVKEGTIQRLGRGLYNFPKLHPKLGPLYPTIEQIAKTLALRDRIRLLPSGAYAANLLGLSEQVPARVVFLTDGESRKLSIERTTIELRKTAPRFMALAGTESGIVFEALRHLGEKRITSDIAAQLSRRLSPATKRELLRSLRFATDWMRKVVLRIAQGERSRG